MGGGERRVNRCEVSFGYPATKRVSKTTLLTITAGWINKEASIVDISMDSFAEGCSLT